MKFRAAVVFWLAAVRFAVPGPGLAASPVSAMARTLLDHQAFTRGDRDGIVRFAIAGSREFQGTPLAELAARLALLYEASSLTAVNVGEAEARRILDAEAELPPDLRDVLRRFVARALAAGGHRDEALAMHGRRGLAMSWLVAGPFFGSRSAGFAARIFPEAGDATAVDVAANPPGPELFAEWRRKPPWRPLHANRAFPFVRPWRWPEREGNGAFLMFTGLSVESPDNRASFRLLSDVSWRLYVDGQLAAEVDKSAAETPKEHMIAFPLSAGLHSVALHLFPPGPEMSASSARVALRLESASPFSWNCEAVRPEPFKPRVARREARRLKYLDDLRAAMDDDPMLMAAYSLACLEQGMMDAASWWMETAARAEPANANLKALAGSTTSLNPLLPPERRGDMAMAWHRSALEAGPDIVPSLVFLAEAAADGGQERQSLLRLSRARSVNPNSMDAMLAMGRWANRFASDAHARSIWNECSRLFPDSPAVQMAVAAMPGERFLDMERRLAACRAAVRAGPFDFEAGIRLANALADSGNGAEAGYVLRDASRLFAGDAAALRDISEVYVRLSMFREAAEAMADAVRLSPDNPALWRRLGDIHMESGDMDGARKFWNASLAADPGQFDLLDMLDYLEGKPARFRDDAGYDAIAMTSEANVGRMPGDVTRILDRSEIIFAGDGSFRRITHEIDLARNRRGGELLAAIDARGEVLTARVVFPDGRTIEPEPFPGQGGLRLPVIFPDSAREMMYLESELTDSDQAPAMPTWYFQDPNGNSSFLISEFVVRSPKGFPLAHAVRNLGNRVELDASEEDGLEVLRWTAKLSLPSREPDAVHVSERVPSVSVGARTTWDEVAFQELRRLEWRLTPSQRMLALLNTLRQPGSDGRPDPERAARAIYRYVCENIEPHPEGEMAAHAQVNRMGDRRLLLLSLLRLAGLDAHPAAARPNPRFLHPPIWELPGMAIFTVPLVRLTMPGGGLHWLDARFESLPFGKIANDLSGATVISCLPGGPVFEALPNLPAEESLVFRDTMLQLPGRGDAPALVSGRIITRGTGGLVQSASLKRAGQDESARMILAGVHSAFPDAVLYRHEVLRPETEDAGSQVRFELGSRFPLETRPDGGRAVSLCLTPVRAVSAEARNLPRRRTACHIRMEHMSEDRVSFILPPGASFAELPKPAHLPSRFGVYQLRVSQRGANRAEIVRFCHIPAQRIQPWDWSDFLSFLEQIDMAEKQWLEYALP